MLCSSKYVRHQLAKLILYCLSIIQFWIGSLLHQSKLHSMKILSLSAIIHSEYIFYSSKVNNYSKRISRKEENNCDCRCETFFFRGTFSSKNLAESRPSLLPCLHCPNLESCAESDSDFSDVDVSPGMLSIGELMSVDPI